MSHLASKMCSGHGAAGKATMPRGNIGSVSRLVAANALRLTLLDLLLKVCLVKPNDLLWEVLCDLDCKREDCGAVCKP